MKNSKQTALLICLVAVLCVVSFMFFKVTVLDHIGDDSYHGIPAFILNQTQNNEQWILTITNTSANQPFGPADFLYVIRNASANTTLCGNFRDIMNKASLEHNVSWIDKDSNNKLSVGDEITISKNGGSVGEAKSGEEFWIVYTYIDGRVSFGDMVLR